MKKCLLFLLIIACGYSSCSDRSIDELYPMGEKEQEGIETKGPQINPRIEGTLIKGVENRIRISCNSEVNNGKAGLLAGDGITNVTWLDTNYYAFTPTRAGRIYLKISYFYYSKGLLTEDIKYIPYTVYDDKPTLSCSSTEIPTQVDYIPIYITGIPAGCLYEWNISPASGFESYYSNDKSILYVRFIKADEYTFKMTYIKDDYISQESLPVKIKSVDANTLPYNYISVQVIRTGFGDKSNPTKGYVTYQVNAWEPVKSNLYIRFNTLIALENGDIDDYIDMFLNAGHTSYTYTYFMDTEPIEASIHNPTVKTSAGHTFDTHFRYSVY